MSLSTPGQLRSGCTTFVAAFSGALGKDVSYVDVPVEAAVEGMVGMGLPQFVADTVAEVFANFATNGGDRVTGAVEELTGHPARSIDDFTRDFASLFQGGG